MRYVGVWICAVVSCGALAQAAEVNVPHVLDERLKIELFAAAPQIVTPTGIAVDAKGRVLVSYFSFHSLKNLLRRMRAPFDGKRQKNTLRSARVREIAADCGFARLRATPLSRLASGHVFASFARATASQAV